MLQSPEYWYKRLDDLTEFERKCKEFQDTLSIFPHDYLGLKKEIAKALKQNELNILWIRQEIATREKLQDCPKAQYMKREQEHRA